DRGGCVSWLRHRLFWPVVTLVLLLVVNAAFNPAFLRIAVRDGHLYGSLVDILKGAAPLALVALGMTLVIATRGIDISVGAVVAGVGMQPIIATLVLMVAGRGIAQLITNGQIITVYYAPFFFVGNGYVLGLPFPFLLALAVFAALMLLVRRTALGLFIEAV